MLSFNYRGIKFRVVKDNLLYKITNDKNKEVRFSVSLDDAWDYIFMNYCFVTFQRKS